MVILLSRVQRGEVERVVVTKLDRLTRSVRDLADLLDLFAEHNVALTSLAESLDTSTVSGRLMLNLLASVSQWEREAIGERTAFALAHMRRNGQVYGPIPFGFQRLGDVLVEHPEAMAALVALREMKANGLTLRKMCAYLEACGLKPRRGYKWHPGKRKRDFEVQDDSFCMNRRVG